MIAKAQIKEYLRRNDAAYWTAGVLYEYSLYPPHIWRQGLTRSALGIGRRNTSAASGAQSVLSWTVDLPRCEKPQDLGRWLRSKGLSVSEGGHALYIKPQAGLADFIGGPLSFYPRGAGFKILKDFRHPRRARYLYKDRYALQLLSRLIGSPYDQVIAANYLYAAGLGARVWDLTTWEFHDSCCTVFVVDHIEGVPPDLEQCGEFLRRLRELNESSPLRVLIPRWQENQEFDPPYCNHNLIYSPRQGGAIYVDFQNFGMTDYNAWRLDTDPARDASDADPVSLVLRDLLRHHRETLHERLVLDIGCTHGGVLEMSLAAGAAWTFGWCAGEHARTIEASLLATGATRFSLFSDVRRTARLSDDMPKALRERLAGAVVLCRGDAFNRRLVEQLSQIPWRILIADQDSPIDEFGPRSRFAVSSATHGGRRVRIIRRLQS